MPYVMSRNGECWWCEGLTFVKTADLAQDGPAGAALAIDEYGRLWSWGKNDDGTCGQGNPYYSCDTGFTSPNDRYFPVPTLVSDKSDWVKIQAGEYMTMGIDESGRLWAWGESDGCGDSDGNCACLALPHDSGTDKCAWEDGHSPRTNQQCGFYSPTRVAPNMTFKDFMHNYLYTHAIGQDDLLYFFGYPVESGSGMDTSKDFYDTPTRVPGVMDTVKIILGPGDAGYGGGVITKDNKVIVWGSDPEYYCNLSSTDPTDITRNLPSGAVIVDAGIDAYGVIVALENGEVWAIGLSLILGKGYDSSKDSFDQWVKVDIDAHITKISTFYSVVLGLDSNNYAWVYGSGAYLSGKNDSLCGSSVTHTIPMKTTNKQWLSINYNHFQDCWTGVDINGDLYCWGSQYYAICNLGVDKFWGGTPDGYTKTDGGELEESCVPQQCIYDAETRTYGGFSPFTADFLPTPADPVEDVHYPCGHWHKIEYEGDVEEIPNNCWQPNVAINEGHVLYVVAGKFPDYEGGGFDFLFLDYDIAANKWTTIYQTDLVHAAARIGQADLDLSGLYPFYAFYNGKQDVIWNDPGYSYDTPVMAFYAWKNGLIYHEFSNALIDDGKNKMGIFDTGLVAVMYQNSSNNDLIVEVSTDYGVSFANKRTISSPYIPVIDGTPTLPSDYGLIVDDNGYIYIAYRTGATTVTVQRSQNQGDSWTNQVVDLDVGTISNVKGAPTMAFKWSGPTLVNAPSDYGTFVLGFIDKLYYSTDEAETWTGVAKANLNPTLMPYDDAGAIIGVISAAKYEDYTLQRYVIEDDAWTTVMEADDFSGSYLENDKATMDEDFGTFVYSENTFSIETSTFNATKVLVSSQEGRYWDEVPTPFRFYESYGELSNRWPIPQWPFQKDLSFKADNQKFTIREQRDKWGYMNDPFYKNFNL